MQKKPKVLIIFGDASETVDTMYPYFRLIEGGYDPGMTASEKHEYQSDASSETRLDHYSGMGRLCDARQS